MGGGAAPSTPALIKVGEGRLFSKRLTLVSVNGDLLLFSAKAKIIAA
jgi:hypothetical protein